MSIDPDFVPDEILARIVGEGPQQRTEIVKRLWKYIKDNKLQSKKMIIADANLKLLFNGLDEVDMFAMNSYVTARLRPIGSSAAGNSDSMSELKRPESMRNLADWKAWLDKLITKNGLADKRDLIQKSATPSILLVQHPPSESTAIPGCSYIGGSPCLPTGFKWPTLHNGTPLSPIAQIQMSDLVSLLSPDNGFLPELLPATGQLNFFIDMLKMSDGRRHDDTQAWRVIYTSPEQLAEATPHSIIPVPSSVEEAELENIKQMWDRLAKTKRSRGPAWLEEMGPAQLPKLTLPCCPLRFQLELTVPAFRSIELLPLELDDDEFEPFEELKQQLATYSKGSVHRMFGHPDAIQGCMQRTAQFITNAAYLPDGIHSYYEHPRAEELMPGAHDWTLLFQLDSSFDDRAEWLWGDNGKLFFWMKREDLTLRAFEKCWYFFQCH